MSQNGLRQAPNTPPFDHFIAGDDHKVKQVEFDKEGEHPLTEDFDSEVACETDIEIIPCVCECFCGIDEQLCTSLFLPFDF